MAEDGKRSDMRGEGPVPTDEATQLKKRARRRLIGAAALALLAAVVLPMVMDHEPAPPLRDIQVRIPSPDEGVTQRVAAKPAVAVAPPGKPPAASPEVAPAAAGDAAPKPIAKAESKPEAKVEPQNEGRAEKAKPAEPDKSSGETWEVQLGAYREAGSVKLLVGKLKELDLPVYTEKVDTANGPRTRVRAGPFPSQEAAEKARVRVKIIGVDGPVAKKQ